MTDDKSDRDIVKSTGMGVIYITFAKLWFMAAGWALVFVLPRLFEWAAGGDAAAGSAMWGMYGLIITGISFVNNGIVTGTIQSVSRFTAYDESTAATVRKKALLTMALAGGAIAVVYALLSGVISKYWFEIEDDNLTFYMQLSAIVIVVYACYSVFIGTLNGLRRFRAQAMFDIGYTTLKIGLIIGFVVAGFQVLGTVLGFICGAALIGVVAAVVTRNTPGNAPFEGKKFIAFARVIIVYTFILNLVLMIDIYVLSGFVPKIAAASGMADDAITEWMKIQAGHYKAVQSLAFIPYQAVIAIAFVVFPLVSRVARESDGNVAKGYITSTLRFTLILIAGLASVFCGVAEGAMHLVFPKGYAVAAPALRVLSLGIIAFGVLVISNTVLNAAGKKWHAMISVLVGMVVVLGLNAFLLATAKSADTSLLTRTAVGTSLGMLITLVISLRFVFLQFKAGIPLLTLLRVAAAAGAAIVAARFMPGDGKLMTLVHCVGVLAIYFGILAVIREFKQADIDRLKQVLHRKAKQPSSSEGDTK